jgi:hypothetical protein
MPKPSGTTRKYRGRLLDWWKSEIQATSKQTLVLPNSAEAPKVAKDRKRC